MSPANLREFLSARPPFDALDAAELDRIVHAAVAVDHPEGATVVDGFEETPGGLRVVVSGRVGLWNTTDALGHEPQEVLTAGGVFGFSAMLTGRPIGPRAVALSPSSTIFVPGELIAGAWTAGPAREPVDQVALSRPDPVADATYGTVDELIVNTPVIVEPGTTVAQVARAMDRAGVLYAVVRDPDGELGLVTDAVLRRRVLAADLPPSTPAGRIMLASAPMVPLGEPAATALIRMLDEGLDILLVVGPDGRVRGAVSLSDFAVSPASAEVTLRQQLAQAPDLADLTRRCRRLPSMAADLLARGLATSKVTALYAATIDAAVRRALMLVLAEHADLDGEEFTWLALGSDARGEPVLNSDVDSAVAFRTDLSAERQEAYRGVFSRVNEVLTDGGLSFDPHRATAARVPFSRTTAQWHSAAEKWLADPVAGQGAIMASLLVDARPVLGDSELPTVKKVFGGLHDHPVTMRLLLTESLSRRARVRSVRDVLAGRGGTFNIKNHALVPVVNIARWAALTVGSTALPTTTRLADAAGSTLVSDDAAADLTDIFETLQRIRLHYQLQAFEQGKPPSDVLVMSRLTALDRSVIHEAVKQITAIQRRMASLAKVTDPEEWTFTDHATQ